MAPLFGIPKKGAIDYSQTLELDLGTGNPPLAGPKRPQARRQLVKQPFGALFSKPVAESGYAKPAGELPRRFDGWFRGSGDASGGGTSNSGSLARGAPTNVVEMVANR